MHQVYNILGPKDNEVAKLYACGSLRIQATQRSSPLVVADQNELHQMNEVFKTP